MFKVSKRFLKSARCAYLYADGHMVIIHERSDADAGTVEWATLHSPKETGIHTVMPEDQRLIINRYAIGAFIRLAPTTVRASVASPDQGSDKSRAAGIAVAYVELVGEHGRLMLHNFPDLITSDMYLFRCAGERWTDIEGKVRWGDVRVSPEYR